jgi:2-polyprenyl-6-methoxyphenol hydroxylase-like FAD-dependent oxidoreductase
VGAGPAGVVTAFGLAKAGAEVIIVEREPDVIASPRASVYLSSTLQVLEELGLLQEALSLGAVSSEFNMRFKLTDHIGRMDHSLILDLTPYGYVLHLGQHELAHMVLRRFLALPRTEVRWNTVFEGLEQHPDGVRVRLSTPEGPQSLDVDWVIGADGARSSVRTAMGVTFDGFTWPETFMATNVYYDFASCGYASSNMVADGADWHVIARLDRQDHHWRIAYGESSGLSEEQRRAHIPERFKRFLPEPKKWELARANSYRVHQRSASSYRVGRVLLAGDAAHATNPIGGMGFTSGVQDARTLILCLSALMQGEAADDALDWYAYERRRIFLEIANPSAIEFKRRTQETDPARRLEDEANFFRMMDDREMTRRALMSIFALVGRPYRSDWQDTYVKEDQGRGSVPATMVLGADATARISQEIE